MAKAGLVSPHTAELPREGAGLSSVRQCVTHEPSFTHRRRVGDGAGQIVSEGVLQHREEAATEKTPALLFRAGHRRPPPGPSPTEYQLQFTWKTGPRPEAPLLSAERLMDNEGARERRGRDGEGKRSEGGGGKVAGRGRVGDVGGGKGGKVRRRDRGGGGGGEGVKMKQDVAQRGKLKEGGMRKRDSGESKGESSGVRPRHHNDTQKPRPRNSTSAKGGGSGDGTSMGKEDSKVAVKSHPHQSQRHRVTSKRHRSRKRGVVIPLGQSEYRTQFKAWPLPSGRGSNTHWKKHQQTISPGKRSGFRVELSPSLLPPTSLPGPPHSGLPGPPHPGPPHSGLPGPPHPGLPEPPHSGLWGTEYSTKYKNPLDFQYVRGAWIETPQPSPTPKGNEVKSEEEPNQNVPSVSPSPVREEDRVSPEESLLAQLSEIRQKAAEYRQRSDGCHFIPTHTSWQPDTGAGDNRHSHSPSKSLSPSSSRSTSVSSCSDDEPTENHQVQPHTAHNHHPSHHHRSQGHQLTNGGIHIEDVEEGERGGEGEGGEGESVDSDTESESDNIHRNTCTQQPDNNPLGVTSGGKISQPPRVTVPCAGGRVSTPVLHDNPKEKRHHLDRTTPSAGSLLTSPPLPAFLKPVKTDARRAAVSDPRGGRSTGGKTGRQNGVKPRAVSSLHTCGGSQQQRKQVTSGVRKGGLHISQKSPRLKRDPSLVSSVSGDPRASSHQHTLPKSTKSHQPPMSHPTSQQPLTKPHPPSLPSSSSFVSSLLGPALSSNGAVKKLDYGTSSRTNLNRQSLPSKPGLTHSHTGCTSTQCGVCGAWLRKMHTGAHVSGLSQEACPASRTRQYKGPVTQLSQRNSHLSSQAVDRSTRKDTLSFHGEPQRQGPTLSLPHQTHSPLLQEPDTLSLSTLSLSSCSVASDLLKKAQERRERFWTQPLSHTSS